MRALVIGLAVLAAPLVVPEVASAADADIIVRKKVVNNYRLIDECGWRRCARRCPDRYSCAPLYGAYGPWGGQQYWASYSYGSYYAWRW